MRTSEAICSLGLFFAPLPLAYGASDPSASNQSMILEHIIEQSNKSDAALKSYVTGFEMRVVYPVSQERLKTLRKAMEDGQKRGLQFPKQYVKDMEAGTLQNAREDTVQGTFWARGNLKAADYISTTRSGNERENPTSYRHQKVSDGEITLEKPYTSSGKADQVQVHAEDGFRADEFDPYRFLSFYRMPLGNVLQKAKQVDVRKESYRGQACYRLSIESNESNGRIEVLLSPRHDFRPLQILQTREDRYTFIEVEFIEVPVGVWFPYNVHTQLARKGDDGEEIIRETFVVFTNPEVNAPISDSIFAMLPPKDSPIRKTLLQSREKRLKQAK